MNLFLCCLGCYQFKRTKTKNELRSITTRYNNVKARLNQPWEYYKNNIGYILILLKVVRQHDCKNIIFCFRLRCMVIRRRCRFPKRVLKAVAPTLMGRPSPCWKGLCWMKSLFLKRFTKLLMFERFFLCTTF